MTETGRVTVYEYLRPENTMERVDYHLPVDCVDKLKILAKREVYPCCDIYPNGECRVRLHNTQYSYDVVQLRGQTHATADVAMRELVRSIDLE